MTSITVGGRDKGTLDSIHRLFREPLSAENRPCPWYRPPGSVVDGSALLRISSDVEFLEAAAWQVLGSELPGSKRRKWLKRLQHLSRTSVLAAMRYKRAGRQHAVTIPGLWLAFACDPPGRSLLGNSRLGRLLDRPRDQILAWRFAQAGRATQPSSRATA